MMNKPISRGFTLVEVLLALAVVAIALTALLKATSQDVANTQRIKEKTISHWIAMHGVAMVQLGLLTVPPNQEITQVTSLLGQRWYWRVKLSPTALGKAVQQMTISVSKNQAGPFTDPLLAFKYQP
ncbi:GspI family T2SS minor pseudopilin variant LspI [Legionella taurinensis]|uniref:Type II secretion system protein I n=2 Tax=Legionella taurinensis TaxID=70611 RepID=A0A3A5LK01_9GAMM|nr:GspI family T2SS minor pseudopilin variant LspI [Legionella taurinensis]RJT48402.1 type II secretion system protein GspI [Legionella taurinensis]RJT68934.1 type II secretion system protein GspI [Legionella taurinensis]STY26155.1 general secretion pathway protein I [Legionella taurinensis]